jgi:hypothetical protein
MENDRSKIKRKIAKLEKQNFQKFSDTPTMTTQSLADRIRRAISWFKRAQHYKSDLPPRYVDLWISLNALYGIAIYKLLEDKKKIRTELTDFQQFLKRLIDTSEKGLKLENLMADPEVLKISKELVGNKYLRTKFWEGTSYGQSIKDDQNALKNATIAKDPEKFFSLVFSRLLIIRNQVFHGSSSSVTLRNADALEPGCKLLEIWLFTFLELMLNCDPAKENLWPPVPYPKRGSNQHPE